jgi:hypothetical protein
MLGFGGQGKEIREGRNWQAGRLKKSPRCPGVTDVECGGKRSATPLSLTAVIR